MKIPLKFHQTSLNLFLNQFDVFAGDLRTENSSNLNGNIFDWEQIQCVCLAKWRRVQFPIESWQKFYSTLKTFDDTLPGTVTFSLSL